MSEHVVVLDCGSGLSKCGYAGEDAPRIAFASVVGRPRHTTEINDFVLDVHVGADAQAKRDILSLKSPIERGIVTNWDDMVDLWKHIFYDELQIVPSDYSMLLTETSLNSRQNREIAAQHMFECFEAPAMYLANQAVLSLYSSARITGIVLDSGYGVTHTVPVHNGYSVTSGINRLDLAGYDLDLCLANHLSERGYSTNTTSLKEYIRDIKENCCYVAVDYEEENNAGIDREKNFHLPDGQEITINEERYLVGEILFKPSLYEKECDGIVETLYNSIMKCDCDLRKEMYSNVIIAGGSTLFPGFAERMRKEILFYAPESTEINVSAPHDRMYSAWIGGSILASLSTFKDMWVSKSDYEEVGASIVHRKCF